MGHRRHMGMRAKWGPCLRVAETLLGLPGFTGLFLRKEHPASVLAQLCLPQRKATSWGVPTPLFPESWGSPLRARHKYFLTI